MTQFYNNLAATALRLVTDKGKTVIIRRPSTATPVKPYRPVVTDTDHSVQAVVEDFRAQEIDGTTIRTGDRKYLVAASGVDIVPNASDKVVDGSIMLEVLSVKNVNPGGIEVIWTLHSRPTGA